MYVYNLVKMVVLFFLFLANVVKILIRFFLRRTHQDNCRFYIPLGLAIIVKNSINCKIVMPMQPFWT